MRETSMIKNYIKILPLGLLLVLAGCTGLPNNAETKSVDLTQFKCTLPSKPGKVDVNLYYVPDTIVVDKTNGAEESFDGYIENSIYTGDTNPLTVKLEVTPMVGKAEISVGNGNPAQPPIDVTLDAPDYYPEANEIIPSQKDFTITLRIPSGDISNIGSMNLIVSSNYDTSTIIYVPLCLGYDPNSIKVSPDVRNCDPLNVPQACYSASPVIPSGVSVKARGSTRHATYIVEVSLSDAYGGIIEENERKRVTIDSINLIVDGATFEAGNSNVIRCTPSPGSKIYLDITNKITCRIDLNNLENECKNNDNCYVDPNSLKVGKGALLDIELSYGYKVEKVYGPIGLEVIESSGSS